MASWASGKLQGWPQHLSGAASEPLAMPRRGQRPCTWLKILFHLPLKLSSCSCSLLLPHMATSGSGLGAPALLSPVTCHRMPTVSHPLCTPGALVYVASDSVLFFLFLFPLVIFISFHFIYLFTCMLLTCLCHTWLRGEEILLRVYVPASRSSGLMRYWLS